MEHHSNIVPWQLLAGAPARVSIRAAHRRRRAGLDAYARLLETAKRPKLVAVTQMSNVLGTLPPVER